MNEGSLNSLSHFVDFCAYQKENSQINRGKKSCVLSEFYLIHKSFVSVLFIDWAFHSNFFLAFIWYWMRAQGKIMQQIKPCRCDNRVQKWIIYNSRNYVDHQIKSSLTIRLYRGLLSIPSNRIFVFSYLLFFFRCLPGSTEMPKSQFRNAFISRQNDAEIFKRKWKHQGNANRNLNEKAKIFKEFIPSILSIILIQPTVFIAANWWTVYGSHQIWRKMAQNIGIHRVLSMSFVLQLTQDTSNKRITKKKVKLWSNNYGRPDYENRPIYLTLSRSMFNRHRGCFEVRLTVPN